MATCIHCGEANPGRARFCLACGRSLTIYAGAASGIRKTVTVVFVDLVGSTPLAERLDAESLRLVLGRYYDEVRRLLEHHGGTVEKFIGDAIVAVFGVPVLHEDDALRAVTAAAGLLTALDGLNAELERQWSLRLLIRVGVNTGEVLVSESADHQTPILGDTVNVAARLEQTAQANEIVIGDSTYRLVRDAVVVDPLPRLTLKGKALPIPAWRLLEVDPEPRRHARADAPMVGREQELSVLRILFDRTIATRRCHLMTWRGDAGVGKTRLVDEFERAIGEQATVLRGRCPPYGEGITYRPIAQMVRTLAGIEQGDSQETGYAKLAALLGDAGHVTKQVAKVLGLRLGAIEPRDTYWALRRMLEALASRRPLILVVDDLHWAQPALLEFIQQMAEWSRDAPILLMCLARPELFDRSSIWAGAKPNAVTLTLSRLHSEQTRELVGHLLRPGAVAEDLQARLAEVAAGYPLFAEELIAMLIDDQTLRLVDGRWIFTGQLTDVRSPPTIHALLSARLDELPESERLALCRAAVVGTRFRAEAIQALSPEWDDQHVRSTLMALVHKELLRVARPAAELRAGGDDGFRFRHSLIREAAYQATPKEARARLHEGYASWLERSADEQGVEVDEMVGYHLEEAYRHRAQLGRQDEGARGLGTRAGERLAEAGHRAAMRGDVPATALELLRRAADLLPDDHERRLGVLLDLAEARRDAESLKSALTTYGEAIELARARGDERYAALAKVGRLETLWFADPTTLNDGGCDEAERAIEVLAEAGDDLGLAKAWRVLAYARLGLGESKKAQEAIDEAMASAERAGDERWEARIVRLRCIILFWGPTPLDQVVRDTEQALESARRTGVSSPQASALSVLARAAAMQGRLAEARALTRAAAEIEVDLSERLVWAAKPVTEGLVELVAGDLEAAEAVLREGYERAQRVGGTGPLANLEVMLARVLLLRGRHEEAEGLVDRCLALAPKSQIDVRVRALGIKALLLAGRGVHREACGLADEAVQLAGRMQQPDTLATVLMDLAEAQRLARRQELAREAAVRALECHELKGNWMAAASVKHFLSTLDNKR
jgi:class 3 adenylate cyclase/tetratricopeptide (TPR) repeat protein